MFKLYAGPARFVVRFCRAFYWYAEGEYRIYFFHFTVSSSDLLCRSRNVMTTRFLWAIFIKRFCEDVDNVIVKLLQLEHYFHTIRTNSILKGELSWMEISNFTENMNSQYSFISLTFFYFNFHPASVPSSPLSISPTRNSIIRFSFKLHKLVYNDVNWKPMFVFLVEWIKVCVRVCFPIMPKRKIIILSCHVSAYDFQG